MSKITAFICLIACLWASRGRAQTDPFASPADELAAEVLAGKMDRIIFPTIQFKGATLEEAVEYLRVKSRDLDTQENRTRRKGINLIVRNADDKRTAPLISLDLKNVSMTAALRRVTEMSGCLYKVGLGEVVVSSRAFKGQDLKPSVKAASYATRTKISVQVAEIVEEKGSFTLPREDVSDSRSESAPGQFELRAVQSESQRQMILKGLAQKKRLTLHPAESKIVRDEVETAFQHKGIPTLKVLVEESADVSTVDLQMTLLDAADKRSGLSVTIWNGQTALLGGWLADQGDRRRQVWIFVTAVQVDGKGNDLPGAPKP